MKNIPKRRLYYTSGFGKFKQMNARFVFSFFVYTLLCSTNFLYATTETLESLVEPNLSKSFELQLTSEESPLTNSAGDDNINILQQHESSGGMTNTEEDLFEWWTNSFGEGHTIDKTITTDVQLETLELYPNPVTNNVYLNLKKTTLVQVYGLTGQMVQYDITQNSLYISSLPKGIYTLKAKEQLPAILIKQ